MSYIGLNTQYAQNLGGQAGCQQHKNNHCCHHVPPTLEVQDVNYEVIREREELRIKIAQLEQNHLQELEILKNNIIAQCESTLEKELREQELSYENQISVLNQKIDSLNKKCGQQDQVIQTIKKENADLEESSKQANIKVTKLKRNITELEQKHEKDIKDLNDSLNAKLKRELEEQENILNNAFERERIRQNSQIEEHKLKINEFQSRMKQVASELEKIRSELHAKKLIADEWRLKYESLQRQAELEIYQLRREVDVYKLAPPQKNLEYEIKELTEKLQRKKLKIQKVREEVRVKTETIVVEKPVEVEKIVEVVKYIPVEKIVKEIQPPKQPIIIQECGVADKSDTLIKDYQRELEDRDRTIERLKIENDDLIAQVREIQLQFDQLQADYLLLQQDRENLIAQISSFNQYLQQLELAYGQKNQELMSKVQQLYSQITNQTKNVGKIVVRIGKDGKPIVENK
ncbi:hypothetical protein ABPG72_001965 [Tetrahymena utriculariae]